MTPSRSSRPSASHWRIKPPRPDDSDPVGTPRSRLGRDRQRYRLEQLAGERIDELTELGMQVWLPAGGELREALPPTAEDALQRRPTVVRQRMPLGSFLTDLADEPCLRKLVRSALEAPGL